MFCMLKKKIYILPTFQNIIQSVKKEVILSMIPNGEKWYYLAVKNVCIIKSKIIKNNGNFYCLSCLHLFRIKNKSEYHKKVCKNKDFYGAIMPSADTKILEFNQYQASDKKHLLLFLQILNHQYKNGCI